MRSSILKTCILSFIAFSSSNAIVLGGSNLGIFGYPSVNCYKPYKPYEFTNQRELDDYKLQIQTYISCVKDYLEKGDYDIKRIQEKQQEAIDQANSR